MMKNCLTKNERNTLHPLITLNVHANEIVSCMMRDNVQCVDSFKWKCYTRTYQNENSCEVRCLDHCVPHFGEFLGNTPRLVMTPLTDRAYMSMMTAMRLGIGSAPSGPAGTGKTETVKDLARMCWQYCCIVSCSDQFDYLNCANILRGVASSGVWCCFDEFNRISVEVLSTMAHQLQTLFTARETKQDTFIIHGEETRIIPSFNINISMNPGYAGRT
jgi:dynein heavy chain